MIFVEALEDQIADVRAGACVALSVLEVRIQHYAHYQIGSSTWQSVKL